MNKLFEFLVHSSTYLAIGTMLTAFTTSLLLSIHLRFEVLLIFLFGTISLYTFNRYAEIKEDEITYPKRTEYVKNKSVYLILLIIISYIITISLALLGGLASAILVLTVTLVMILYSLKWVIRLKEIVFVKNIVISISWGVVLAFLPIFFLGELISLSAIIVFITLSTMTFVNTVIFDVRDIDGDRINKIKTIPVLYGLKFTKRFLLVINTVLFSFIILCTKIGYLTEFGYIIALTILYLYFVIFMVGHKNMSFVADILGDGWLSVYGIIGFVIWVS